MNSLEIKETQEVVLKGRKDLLITGVKKLESLNEQEFVIYTALGKMQVKGSGLEMKSLNIDKGDLLITGNVRLIEYVEKVEKQKEKGFLTKLFK